MEIPCASLAKLALPALETAENASFAEMKSVTPPKPAPHVLRIAALAGTETALRPAVRHPLKTCQDVTTNPVWIVFVVPMRSVATRSLMQAVLLSPSELAVPAVIAETPSTAVETAFVHPLLNLA